MMSVRHLSGWMMSFRVFVTLIGSLKRAHGVLELYSLVLTSVYSFLFCDLKSDLEDRISEDRREVGVFLSIIL